MIHTVDQDKVTLLRKTISEMGCYELSSGTLRLPDLLETHADICAKLYGPHDSVVIDARTILATEGWDDNLDLTEAAMDTMYVMWVMLNSDAVAPAGYYYGTHVGDGSRFGWWEEPEYWDEP